MKQRYLLLLSLSCFTLNQEIFFKAATAQVIPDGTTHTTVEVNGNNFEINNGDRAGENLFHSFSDFLVPNQGSAFFNNALDIVNIFSRVTGGNISNINGLLGANGTANLFLINPAGIIFGEGARLDIGGSFYGSTADSILFTNGEFSATDLDNSPVLTINVPMGLNFRDNPGEIVNQSVAQNIAGDLVGLEVTSEQTLALVGGDINFETGNVTARGGKIELGGLSAAGTVEIKNNGSLGFSNAPRANIILTNSSNLDVTGTDAQGGNISIDAEFVAALPNENIDNQRLGGNITISTRNAEKPPVNDIRGGAGNISITATFIPIFPNRVSNSFGNLSPAFIIPSDTKIPMNLIESEHTFVPVCQSKQNTEQSTGLTIKDLKPIKTSIGDIYPARGIIKTKDGKIILTSYPTDNTNTRTTHTKLNCQTDLK